MEVEQLQDQGTLREKETEVGNLIKENQRLLEENSKLKNDLKVAGRKRAAEAEEKLDQFRKHVWASLKMSCGLESDASLELAGILSSRNAQEEERRVRKVMEVMSDGDDLDSEGDASDNNMDVFTTGDDSTSEDQHGTENPHLIWGELDQPSKAKAVETLKRPFRYESDFASLTCFLKGPILTELINGNLPTQPDLYRSIVKTAFSKYQKVNVKRKSTLSEIEFTEVHAQLGIDQLFPLYSTDLAPFFKETLLRKEIVKMGLMEMSSTVRKEEIKFINKHLAEYFIAKWITDKLREGNWNDELSSFLNATLDTTFKHCSDDDLDDFKYYNGMEEWNPRRDNCYCDCHEDDDEEEEYPHRYEFSKPEFLSILDSLIEEQLTTFPSVRIEFSHGYWISAKSEAFAHHNFYNILKLLCQMGTHQGRALSNMLFFEKTTHIAMLKSGVEYFKLANPIIKDEDWMDDKLKAEALRKAVQRLDLPLVEFFLDEMGMIKLVENPNDKLLNLVHLCVEHSESHKDELLEQQVKILNRLHQINPSLLNAWALNEEYGRKLTPLLCSEVHVKLLIELIKLGADVSVTLDSEEHKLTFLHLNAFLPGNEFESLLTCVGEKRLRHLANWKDYSNHTILHSVVNWENPSTETIKLLVEAGSDINAIDKDGYSVLATAVKEGCPASVITQLIDFGASVGWKGKKGESLLHLTAKGRRGNVEAIDVLLKQKTIKKTCKDENGLTALDYAIKSRWDYKVDVGVALHKAGVKFKHSADENGQTLLHEAARDGEIKTIELLLQLNFNVHALDNDGNTPLHFSTTGGRQEETVKLLLDNNANPNMRNRNGDTPFQFGVKKRSLKQESFLLLKPATNIDWTPAFKALTMEYIISNDRYYSVDGLQKMLDSMGCDTDDFLLCMDDNQNNLLHIATSYAKEHAVKLLVAKVLDINAKNKFGRTPLHITTIFKDKDNTVRMAKCLIDNGADLNAKDGNGYNFLDNLIPSNGFKLDQLTELIEFLRVKNLVSAFNVHGGENGSTPFQNAVMRFKLKDRTLERMSSNGVDLKVVDFKGNCALAYAIKGGRNSKFLSKLVELGADWYHVNLEGQSILYAAVEAGNLEVLDSLIARRLNVNCGDRKWNTPMHWLMQVGEKNILAVALKLKGEWAKAITTRNNDRHTPLEIAMMRDDADEILTDELKLILQG